MNARAATDRFAQAANAGHVAAINELGRCYQEGRAVTRDAAMALRWFKQAADRGLVEGAVNAGSQLAATDAVQARHYFSQAAEAGHALAQFNLAVLYAEGRGGEIDHPGAFAWWQKAADQDQARAQLELARSYRSGRGTNTNPGFAEIWYTRSSAQGNTAATSELAELRAEQSRAQPTPTDLTEVVARSMKKAAESLATITRRLPIINAPPS